MSFGALPTELDATIINYLQRGDLSRLSRVSKYYRNTAESVLYKNIEFRTCDHNRVKRLLLTLLHRPDLRPLIHRFRVHHDPNLAGLEEPHVSNQIILPEDLEDAGLYQTLMVDAPLVNAAVSDLAALYGFHPQFKMAMFAKVFEPCPLYDGALALILGMTTKLTSLEIDLLPDETLAMTRHLLNPTSWPWTGPNHIIANLSSLRLRGLGSPEDEYGGSYNVIVHPTIETLEITGNTSDSTNWYAGPESTSAAVLKSLTLKDINIGPSLLENIVKASYSMNLESFKVFGVGRNGYCERDEHVWEQYDYSRLKSLMLENLPNLQYFTWMEPLEQKNVHSFGSLGSFGKLKELALDGHLLAKHADEDNLQRLPSRGMMSEYYATTLTKLEIGYQWWTTVCTMCAAYMKDDRTGQNGLNALAANLACLPMKVICLTVDLSEARIGYSTIDDEFILDDGAVNMLRTLSDLLETFGVRFSVSYHYGYYDKPSRVLVAPNYTAKLLYYKDNSTQIWDEVAPVDDCDYANVVAAQLLDEGEED
jgi:hypothetical protein